MTSQQFNRWKLVFTGRGRAGSGDKILGTRLNGGIQNGNEIWKGIWNLLKFNSSK